MNFQSFFGVHFTKFVKTGVETGLILQNWEPLFSHLIANKPYAKPFLSISSTETTFCLIIEEHFE
ncbi:hypothetical protein G6R27_03835 [Fructobacillus sp. M1-10]|uniref:Uncharacterized protein n=1 Tax=Fructobacillus papyriferae TaxID=2713171 RepID=A0ABS5QQP5_9LACO|nr:hypothetical protein [Fructobacillus papyriferae]MBS9335162.1 hypothetical protein [Fructobacillus papyriferae]